MTTTSVSRRHIPRAFTLIELLVVIVIIGVLTAIVVTVAGRVTKSGKTRLTQESIRVLDNLYTEYVQVRDGKPPEMFLDDAGFEFPIVDGRIAAGGTGPPPNLNGPAEPTLSLFLLTAVKVPEVEAILKSLDPRLIEEVDVVSALGTPQIRRPNGGALANARGLVVKDAFGEPIRFVHPTFDNGYGRFWNGTTVDTTTRGNLAVRRRNGGPATVVANYSRSYRPWAPSATGAPDNRTGDSDEGICIGGRAYFYSAGIDGDPGTRDDNVYTTRPQFPAATAAFNN